jgi:hypothetical protein
MLIDEGLRRDVITNSAGDCWYSWATDVGVPTGNNQHFKKPDLTTWESCPRIRPKSYLVYATHANNRICAAHHLIAGPYKPETESKSNICSCPINDLMACGCSCGGE